MLTYNIHTLRGGTMDTRRKMNPMLHELGHTLGLNDTDITRAKQTTKSMLGMAIISAVVILIGRIVSSQLDATGLYYVGVSIRDFGFFSRFF